MIWWGSLPQFSSESIWNACVMDVNIIKRCISFHEVWDFDYIISFINPISIFRLWRHLMIIIIHKRYPMQLHNGWKSKNIGLRCSRKFTPFWEWRCTQNLLKGQGTHGTWPHFSSEMQNIWQYFISYSKGWKLWPMLGSSKKWRENRLGF
jgi:hypothetical protein